MYIVNVECVKSDNKYFVVGNMYEAVVGYHGDRMVQSDGGSMYNLDKNFQHSKNLTFEVVDAV